MNTNLFHLAGSAEDRSAAVQSFIMHHMVDGHEWTVWPGLHVPLPPFLTLHGAMAILAARVLLLLFGVLYRRQDAVPSGLTNALELFVEFIRDKICIPYLGEDDGRRMTPVFCSFFFFILTMNMLGLVPCFASATANVSVTGALACVSFGFMVFGAMYRHGVAGFFKGFIPEGVPWPILIILLPVELIGVFIKSFALCIRLFANMLAGHIVIFSLLGLVLMFGWVALPSVAMALGIYLMEVFIAFLQAFIFTLLSAVFIGQRYHPAH